MQGSYRASCKDGDRVVGFYEVNTFPGCNQVAVSNHAFISPEHRGQGYGTKFHKQRLEWLRSMGYDYVLCSVRAGNTPQIKILEQFGWKLLSGFHNRDTDNVVQLWGKNLT